MKKENLRFRDHSPEELSHYSNATSDIEYLFNKKYELNKFEEEQLVIEIKYEGYIKKEYQVAKKMESMENWKIPEDIDYDKISNIALEAKDKLKKVRPATVSQASRISGVNPSDISILLVYLESYKRYGK